MTRRTRRRAPLAALLAIGLLGAAIAQTASATQPSPDHKVTICHRTNSDSNPYVRITVDYAAVDGVGKNDHSRHTGPVWSPGLKAAHVKWGDIIPPVQGVTAGLNWTAEGIAIYDDGCKTPTPEPTPTPTATPSDEPCGADTDDPCPTPTPEVTPTPTPAATPTPEAPTPTPTEAPATPTPPSTDTGPASASSPAAPNALLAVLAAIGLVGGMTLALRPRRPR